MQNWDRFEDEMQHLRRRPRSDSMLRQVLQAEQQSNSEWARWLLCSAFHCGVWLLSAAWWLLLVWVSAFRGAAMCCCWVYRWCTKERARRQEARRAQLRRQT
jgi:Flp pilus assembly protein TadB